MPDSRLLVDDTDPFIIEAVRRGVFELDDGEYQEEAYDDYSVSEEMEVPVESESQKPQLENQSQEKLIENDNILQTISCDIKSALVDLTGLLWGSDFTANQKRLSQVTRELDHRNSKDVKEFHITDQQAGSLKQLVPYILGRMVAMISAIETQTKKDALWHHLLDCKDQQLVYVLKREEAHTRLLRLKRSCPSLDGYNVNQVTSMGNSTIPNNERLFEIQQEQKKLLNQFANTASVPDTREMERKLLIANIETDKQSIQIENLHKRLREVTDTSLFRQDISNKLKTACTTNSHIKSTEQRLSSVTELVKSMRRTLKQHCIVMRDIIKGMRQAIFQKKKEGVHATRQADCQVQCMLNTINLSAKKNSITISRKASITDWSWKDIEGNTGISAPPAISVELHRVDLSLRPLLRLCGVKPRDRPVKGEPPVTEQGMIGLSRCLQQDVGEVVAILRAKIKELFIEDDAVGRCNSWCIDSLSTLSDPKYDLSELQAMITASVHNSKIVKDIEGVFDTFIYANHAAQPPPSIPVVPPPKSDNLKRVTAGQVTNKKRTFLASIGIQCDLTQATNNTAAKSEKNLRKSPNKATGRKSIFDGFTLPNTAVGKSPQNKKVIKSVSPVTSPRSPSLVQKSPKQVASVPFIEVSKDQEKDETLSRESTPNRKPPSREHKRELRSKSIARGSISPKPNTSRANKVNPSPGRQETKAETNVTAHVDSSLTATATRAPIVSSTPPLPLAPPSPSPPPPPIINTDTATPPLSSEYNESPDQFQNNNSAQQQQQQLLSPSFQPPSQPDHNLVDTNLMNLVITPVAEPTADQLRETSLQLQQNWKLVGAEGKIDNEFSQFFDIAARAVLTSCTIKNFNDVVSEAVETSAEYTRRLAEQNLQRMKDEVTSVLASVNENASDTDDQEKIGMDKMNALGKVFKLVQASRNLNLGQEDNDPTKHYQIPSLTTPQTQVDNRQLDTTSCTVNGTGRGLVDMNNSETTSPFDASAPDYIVNNNNDTDTQSLLMSYRFEEPGIEHNDSNIQTHVRTRHRKSIFEVSPLQLDNNLSMNQRSPLSSQCSNAFSYSPLVTPTAYGQALGDFHADNSRGGSVNSEIAAPLLKTHGMGGSSVHFPDIFRGGFVGSAISKGGAKVKPDNGIESPNHSQGASAFAHRSRGARVSRSPSYCDKNYTYDPQQTVTQNDNCEKPNISIDPSQEPNQLTASPRGLTRSNSARNTSGIDMMRKADLSKKNVVLRGGQLSLMHQRLQQQLLAREKKQREIMSSDKPIAAEPLKAISTAARGAIRLASDFPKLASPDSNLRFIDVRPKKSITKKETMSILGGGSREVNSILRMGNLKTISNWGGKIKR